MMGSSPSPPPLCPSKLQPMPQCRGAGDAVRCSLHWDLHRKSCLCSVSKVVRACFYHAVNMLLQRAISVKPTARLSVSV